MNDKSIKTILTTFFLILIVSLLSYLRMVPAIDNSVEFRFDKAFNYRMTAMAVKDGDVPDVDHLSTYPDGKRIKAFLPVGMYRIAAAVFKFARTAKPISLNRFILLFTSISASLICIPIYFLSYEVYKNRTVAWISALLAGLIPAYLHRSMCYWYRYEAITTTVLFASLFFFVKMLGARGEKKAYLYSILCALSIALSLYMWRLSILFLLAYVIVFIYLALRKEKPSKNWWVPIALVLVISFIFLWSMPSVSGKTVAHNYGSIPKATSEIIMYKMGLRGHLSQLARLLSDTRELKGTSLKEMFSGRYLSFSGIFVILYFVSYFGNKARDVKRGTVSIFLILFLALTFIFSRNKIILGPLVALAMGEGFDFALKKKKALGSLILCIAIVAISKTGFDSYRLATTRYRETKLRPHLKQILTFVNENVPKNAVLLCHWPDGYPIQTFCNRPTTTDSLLESPEIVNRIMSLSKIYYSYSEKDLVDFSNKYGARYILVPTNKKRAYAIYNGLKYTDYYRQGKPTEGRPETLLDKLIFKPEKLTLLRLLYSNKEYRLYRTY